MNHYLAHHRTLGRVRKYPSYRDNRFPYSPHHLNVYEQYQPTLLAPTASPPYEYGYQPPPPAHLSQQVQGPHTKNQSSYEHMFENPLQPEPKKSDNLQMELVNPYPNPMLMSKPPNSGFQTFMNSFKSQDGTIDFHKMASTANQMVNAVTQVSNMVKGLGSMFKT